jgi:chromosome segregation ATPase
MATRALEVAPPRAEVIREKIAALEPEIAGLKKRVDVARGEHGRLQTELTETIASGKRAPAELVVRVNQAAMEVSTLAGLLTPKEASLNDLRAELQQVMAKASREDQAERRRQRMQGLSQAVTSAGAAIAEDIARLVEFRLPAYDRAIEELIGFAMSPAENTQARETIAAAKALYADASFLRRERELLKSGWIVRPNSTVISVRTIIPPQAR